MAQREVTARSVSTYVRPDGSGVDAMKQRHRQVRGAFQQLGAHFENERRRDLADLSERTRADANNRARVLAAEYMPKIREEMERPETYQQTADEFMQSETFQRGIDAITGGIAEPDFQKEFIDQYKGMMLEAFTKGKIEHEQKERIQTASLAQQSAADHQGIEGHMAAFDDSIAMGVERADAFKAGLSTAILKGPKYLEQFAKAKDWTPEEDMQIQTQLKKLKTANGHQGDLQWKLLQNVQDRRQKLGGVYQWINKYQGTVPQTKINTALAMADKLQKEIVAENSVRSRIGYFSPKDMANGIGVDNGYRLEIGEIKRIRDEEFHRAVSGEQVDVPTLARLMNTPGDIPDAAKTTFGTFFRLAGNIDPSNPEHLAQLGKLVNVTDAVSKSTSDGVLKQTLGADEYLKLQMFRSTARHQGLEAAVQSHQRALALEAEGKWLKPENMAEAKRQAVRKVASAMSESWFGVDSDINLAALGASIDGPLTYALMSGKTPDEAAEALAESAKKTSWEGHYNGGALGARLQAMTQGINGNPFGDMGPKELLEGFKKRKIKELKAEGIEVDDIHFQFSEDGSTVFLSDPGSLFIPNGVMSIDQIEEEIRQNQRTLKEEIEYEASPEYKRERAEEFINEFDPVFSW